MAKHKNLSQWQLLYNNFLEHQGTIAEYCAKHNINPKTFSNWCYKFRRSNNIKNQSDYKSSNDNQISQSKFIKLQLPLNEVIKIRLPNGIVIEILSKNLPMIVKELIHVI